MQEYLDLALKLKSVTEEESQEVGDTIICSAENCCKQDETSIKQVGKSTLVRLLLRWQILLRYESMI